MIPGRAAMNTRHASMNARQEAMNARQASMNVAAADSCRRSSSTYLMKSCPNMQELMISWSIATGNSRPTP